MLTNVNDIKLPTQEVNISEDTNKNRFVVAKEIALFSKDGEDAEYNSLATQFKGIVNSANIEQIFNIVSSSYKLAQHDDVYNATVETVKDLGFRTTEHVLELNDGARLRLALRFPDLNVTVANDSVNMVMTVDNSYNATTGLRCSIDGWIEKGEIKLKVREQFSYFYHRHTKGLSINDLIPTVERGIKVFQEKIKVKFQTYAKVDIDPEKVIAFLEQCYEDKVIAQKYLNFMIRRAKETPIKTQWELYKVINEVMHTESNSEDIKDRFSQDMDFKVMRNLSSLLKL